MSSVVRRRIYAADFKILDDLISSAGMPVPERSFANSLFREIKFASQQDTETFDLIAYIVGIEAR